MLADFQKVRTAVEKLKAMPDDLEANLAYGRFLCFTKSDWTNGLTLLAKGSDADLKELAEKDLVAADNSRLEVADAWWAVSEKQSGAGKVSVQRHAAELYKKALHGLSGLNRSRVEKRLEEFAASKAAPGPFLRRLKTSDVVGSYRYEQRDGKGIMNLLPEGVLKTQVESGTAGRGKGSWSFDEKSQTLTVHWVGWKDAVHTQVKPGVFVGKHESGFDITLEFVKGLK